MEKVICDVCGTDYPETAAQCPICGCARGDGGQTSAGNTTAEERPAYTYTKGGHFSKANVRKRLKAAQKHSDPVVMPKHEPDYDEGEEYDEEEGGSNRGLIVIVVLLLLAIIAVSSYIAIVHFDLLGGNDTTTPVSTTGTAQTTKPTLPSGVQIPCEKLTVTDTEINLVAKDSVWQLSFSAEPIDTTEQVQFHSSDESVAIVDATGRVTAVGSGEAVITISCGSFSSECVVKCNFGGTITPSDPSDPSDPADPVDPVVELKLNRTDFTLSKKGESWKLYSGEIDPAEITWTSNNEAVCTVENGKVVAVGVGRTLVVAEYEGQKATCWVSCSWKEEKPAEPADPVDPSEPDDTVVLELNRTDFTLLRKGEVWNLYSGELDPAEITWTSGNESVVTVKNGKVEAVGLGQTTVYAEYQGQKVSCKVYCRWTET